MTASVPNGFSPEELQRLLAQAQSEDSVESEGCNQDGLTDYQQRIIKVAEDQLQSALDELLILWCIKQCSFLSAIAFLSFTIILALNT